MSAATDSDDGLINQQHMYNWFEIACVPAGTRLYECSIVNSVDGDRGTFCTSPLQAVHQLVAQTPPRIDQAVELRVAITGRDMHVFDLDPLQYTRAYTIDMLALLAGASSKKQRRRVLTDMIEYALDALRAARPELDSLAILTTEAKTGFAWTFNDCIDEIIEHHPVAGLVAAPADTLLAPPTLCLVRRRALIQVKARIGLGPQLVAMLAQTPLHNAPTWPLRAPTDDAMRVLSIGMSEPTGYTSLAETGWRRTNTLRNDLRRHATALSLEPPDALQLHACKTLQHQCDALFATSLPE